MGLMLGLTSHTSAGVITGPFAPGSGNWNLLPNGDFETGDTTGFQLHKGYVHMTSSIGVDGVDPFAGNYSGVLTYEGGGGFWGHAISADPVTLPLGGNYVLSGFVRAAVADTANSGRLDRFFASSETYFDMTNPDWQFVYEEFTNLHGFWYPRFHHGGSLLNPMNPGDKLFVDQFALTPASEFQPPTLRPAGVPDGGTSVLMLGSSLVAFGLFQRRR